MPAEQIEDKPYNEGTLTKLDLFQLYARAWLPVFTSRPEPIWKRLHVFDFFAGRGRDCEGNPGSPTRLLTEIRTRWDEISQKSLAVTLTACDSSLDKIQSLTEYFKQENLIPHGLKFDPQDGEFSITFERYLPTLQNRDVACLVLLDQYGFKQVDTGVFQKLTRCPTTDILFFVSTQHLHRFADHPDVKKYIELERAEDYHLAHQQVMKWYRSQIPAGIEYYLAPFSFRKGSNIYSVIFGSSHPRGMEQFLSVAWQKDKLNGEADYDLNREDFSELAPYLAFDMFAKPRKTQVFEACLEEAIHHGKVKTEREIYLFCLENGMLPNHASPVLAKLKKENVIECAFRSPSRDSLKTPRHFRVIPQL
jgi:three-Cys-motif partner protein